MAEGPARRQKQHYSFDDERLESIGRENMALLGNLARIATRPSDLAKQKPAVLKQTSSFTINRRKQAAEIEKQNMVSINYSLPVYKRMLSLFCVSELPVSHSNVPSASAPLPRPLRSSC
jgi:hypothetical protein